MLKSNTMEVATAKLTLQQLHLEHEVWLNELSFYRDEMRILDKYLLEIVSKNTGQDVLKGVEHFQNQFIRQREVLDELTHDIREQENKVITTLKSLNPIQIEKTKYEDHAGLREHVKTFQKLYGNLKAEFQDFVSRWL